MVRFVWSSKTMNFCQSLSCRCSSCEDLWYSLFCSFFPDDHRGKILSIPRVLLGAVTLILKVPFNLSLRAEMMAIVVFSTHVYFKLLQLTKLISVGNRTSWWGWLFWLGSYFISSTKQLIYFLLIVHQL